MATLDEVTTPAADGTITVLDGWRQGRGAYGGLTIAAAIRAIEAKVSDASRLVRSVTAEIPGPTVPGEAAFTVDILRSGSSLSVARAALAQNGEVTTHAVAVLAKDRDAPSPPTWRDMTPPPAPAWSSIEPQPPAVPGRPDFTQYFEYRQVAGVPFVVESGPAQAIGWIRPREPARRRDAAYVAALIDAWWPAVFVRMPMPRPLGTITFALEIVGNLHAIGDAPLLYRGTVPIAGNGYFLETRELWTEDGQLLALNHQTFAVIR